MNSTEGNEGGVDDVKKTAHEIARDLRAAGMGCNCDLDNWEPTTLTGHSHVCRIHKLAIAKAESRT